MSNMFYVQSIYSFIQLLLFFILRMHRVFYLDNKVPVNIYFCFNKLKEGSEENTLT